MSIFRNNLKNILLVSSRRLSNKSVRVRFAPSPTGFLHLGGLRTAFFNYLFAKKHNGTFILRIEDTDRERIVPGSLEHIIDTLKWSKLVPDEGPTFGGNYGPYLQSERSELYKKMIQKLLNNKSVYHCFCTSKRLELLKREAAKNRETIKYDNRCRSLSDSEVKENILAGKQYTIRLKLKEGPLTVNDIVYGDVTHDVSKTEGDPILMKSDGLPTYHFANVVDDHFMEISHVLRGVEWLISTQKHLMLYEAFGWSPPRYAHLPLIINKDGTKLSKRHDHIQIDSFRNKGYYNQTINNYLTQMGGGFGNLPISDCQQIFSLSELANNFNLENVNENPSKIDLEKLKYLNRVCIRDLSQTNINYLIDQLLDLFKKESLEAEESRIKNISYIRRVIEWSLDRIYVLNELTNQDFKYLWTKPTYQWNISSFGSKEIIEKILLDIIESIQKIGDNEFFDNEKMLENLKNIHKKYNEYMKYGPYMRMLRFSLTNLKTGAPIVETMNLLGKEITIEHLKNALIYVQSNKNDNS